MNLKKPRFLIFSQGNRRNIIISVVLLLAVLFAVKIGFGFQGTCFDVNVCYEGDSSECAEHNGEFYWGFPIADVEKCDEGCCCTPFDKDPYPIFRGTCEEYYNGLFLDFIDNLDDCNAICGQSNLCKPSCVLNEQACSGMGIMVNAERYYCWELNTTYTAKSDCDSVCPTVQYEPEEGVIPEGDNTSGVEGECEEINPPAVDIYAFKANAVKGKRKVELTWDNPCPLPEKVVGYSIWREPGHIEGEFLVTDTSFIDGEVEWSNYGEGYPLITNKYIYHIKVHYDSGRSSFDSSTSITMGHSACEGVFNENEFCLVDPFTGALNKGYQCDENNDLEHRITCDIDYVCFVDSGGFTGCKPITDCGEEGNPFGLFHTEEICLDDADSPGIDTDAYCYYDYSDTIVDDCKDCASIDDCYGYWSEDACLADNCMITSAYSLGEDDPCNWIYTFEEFGKGICYDEDYNGAGYCNLCNENSGVFNNINCDQSLCSKLGACFLEDGSCEPCSEDITCRDFEDEASCVNSHSLSSSTPVSIDNCQITRSDDVCGLGACKWGQPEYEMYERCFKDADDDGSADCGYGEERCKDFEAFITEPQPDIGAIKMGAQGQDLTFYLTEGGMGDAASFYFCIGKDNSCCPDQSNPDHTTTIHGSLGQNPYVVINPLEKTDIITEHGMYFIRYYSVDTNHNVEEIKSTQFLADPTEPEITLTYDLSSEGGHYYSTITATSNEYVNCDYNLHNLPSYKDTNFNSGLNLTFFMRFEDLEKGHYEFTALCTDMVNNLATKTLLFNMMDMSIPPLEFFPYPLPEVVFEEAYSVTGFTDASLDVYVELYDSGGSNPIHYPLQYSTQKSAGILEPISEFTNIPVWYNLSGQLPSKGATEIFFDGDYMGILSTTNHYIEFSDHIKVPRYKITSKQIILGDQTKITISPPLEQDIDIATASAYTSDEPAGWFSIPVVLRSGLNYIKVIATRESSNSNDIMGSITYDNLYEPTIELDYPAWTGTTIPTKNPTFIGSITSATIGVSITVSELTINGTTYALTLDNDGRFSQTVNLPEDGDYIFTILANNSEDYSSSPSGSITIDTAGPGGCITVKGVTYCTPGVEGVNCTDSDNGESYYDEGSCTDSAGIMNDECIVGEEHDGWLREIVCQDDACHMIDYDCPNGCQEGACLI